MVCADVDYMLSLITEVQTFDICIVMCKT